MSNSTRIIVRELLVPPLLKYYVSLFYFMGFVVQWICNPSTTPSVAFNALITTQPVCSCKDWLVYVLRKVTGKDWFIYVHRPL